MSVKANVLEALEQADGKYISGNQLARETGVSRNMIWKIIGQLKAEGYCVEAVTNLGYRLITENSDAVNEAEIQKYLDTESLGRKLEVYTETDSTNNRAKFLAVNENAPDGTLIIAEKQTNGRGRMGRTFESPLGSGIYFTVVLRRHFEMQSAPLITSCVAVAVAEAIEKLSGADTKIKWVNDIFINNRKVGGILTEAGMNFETRQLDYAVVGIGINTGIIENTLSDNVKNIATSIEAETGIKVKRAELVAEVMNRFEKHLATMETKDYMDEYRRRSLIIGKEVVVSKGSSEREAIATDIDNNAFLIVKYDDGTCETLSSGEARIIKK